MAPTPDLPWPDPQNFVGIIPLALILGDVTEDLALRCGDVVGGLVNATFGNVVELIISCVALTKGTKELNQVAGLSNLGSVLSNLLLVLGAPRVPFLHSTLFTLAAHALWSLFATNFLQLCSDSRPDKRTQCTLGERVLPT